MIMRNVLLMLMALVIFSCTSEQKQDVVGTYGDEISETGAITVDAMMAKLDDADTVNVKVRGEITSTCAMKGCWMNLVMPNGEEVRVTFKDYAFFVPKEGMEGNEALVEGVVTKTVTDVETLRHYAADAGKSADVIDAITEAKEELAFEASGVIIYKTNEEAASE